MLNKKVIIIIVLVAIAVVAVVIGVIAYKPQQQSPVQKDDVMIDGVETNAGNSGGLFICADKCGDGVCQSETCTDNMNCTCQEDYSVCPQDCEE